MNQIDTLGQIIEQKDFEQSDLKADILQLEMKNRKLNEIVNKHIYQSTQDNIDKTMNVLKKRGDPNPDRARK